MEIDHPTIRIMLVDDNETIHQEFGEALSLLDDIELIIQGRNGKEAVELCDKYQPDIILMDISMPLMNGIEATAIILKRRPKTKIIAISGIDDKKIVQDMIATGAVGYILKDSHPQEWATAIRTVYSGKSVFSTQIVQPLLNTSVEVPKSPRDYGLTRREMDVLREMGHGLNNSEVANSLNISTATVRFHITNIIVKLGANNRTEALVIATRDNLI